MRCPGMVGSEPASAARRPFKPGQQGQREQTRSPAARETDIQLAGCGSGSGSAAAAAAQRTEPRIVRARSLSGLGSSPR